ncbi:MAG: helix-turn-helix domain-containing protein [Chitinophagaceae bacterium]|nr:helix-turn-helix domain-containing protein [Chitinophagaceae bacterium]
MKAELIDVNLTGSNSIRIKKVNQHYLNAPFHFHSSCELVWVEKSFGKRIVGDNIGNFKDNDLVLMGPNLPHIWRNDEMFHKSTQSRRVKATVIYFSPTFLLNLVDDPEITKVANELIRKATRGLIFRGKCNEKVCGILANIEKESGFNKIIRFLQAIEILATSKEYEYLASMSFKNMYAEKDTDRLSNVYQFLMLNFSRNIDLKEIADMCNMTSNSFCRFFKSRTQKSFTQFLNELRIGHACRLLQEEKYSVSDACYKSGYNNPANFNKFFKSIIGQTPSEYRKRLKI